MRLLHKNPAVPPFGDGPHHSSFPTNSRYAAVHSGDRERAIGPRSEGRPEGLRAVARLTLDGRKDLGALSARCQFNSALSERSWTS